MSKPDAALFVLVGRKPAYNKIFLAPKSALQWCYNADYGDQPIPRNVLGDLTPFLDSDYDGDPATDTFDITPGSADNDVALALSQVCRAFKSPIEAMEYAFAHYTVNSADCYTGLEY
jgi:hypothetical protein